jgi:adenylate cyclase
MVANKKPTPKEIRAQLKRILECNEFNGSENQKNFLKFIVDETLANRTSQLKGYTVGVAVYGRTPDFDPQADPIVRVEAGRLRRALEHYYLTSGGNDPVRIEIPKGRYVPTFHIVQTDSVKAGLPAAEREPRVQLSGPSIAVLPLLNLTGDSKLGFFVDGLTEELTNELARYQDLQVIGAWSAMRFKEREEDAKEIGRKLGVRFLLSGSVRRDSKTIKVTVHLIDSSTGVQIWSDNYRRELIAADLISLQEDIASSVVGVIADNFGSISRSLFADTLRKKPKDLESYDAALRFYDYERNLTLDAFEEALDALQRAIEQEPKYGLAWAMLGHLHADNHALEFCDISDSLGKALNFAQRGVALEPDNQFAQDAITLVHFQRGDKGLFLKHVERTIELNPNAPYIVGVAGWHLMLFGEWERGYALLKQGIKLNPYYPSWFHLAPYMYYYDRHAYDEALAEALRFGYPDLFWDPALRAAALSQTGKKREALAGVDELIKLVPDFAACGRRLISRYVKKDGLVDKFIEGLRKAGLKDIF